MSIEKFTNKNINLKNLLIEMPDEIKKRCVVQEFEAKTTMVKKDENPKYIYIIYSGILNIFNEFENGKILQTARVHDMDFVGVMEALASKDKIAATVETATKCTALRMPKDDFLDWMQRDHELAILVAKKMADNFYSTTYSNGKLLLNSTMYTLVSFIIDTVKDDIVMSELGIVNKKRQQIADELGISLRTVQRNIKKLKETGLITINTGKINVDIVQYKGLVDKLDELI